jgi:hypothetical protein
MQGTVTQLLYVGLHARACVCGSRHVCVLGTRLLVLSKRQHYALMRLLAPKCHFNIDDPF